MELKKCTKLLSQAENLNKLFGTPTYIQKEVLQKLNHLWLACHRMAALKKNTVPFPKHARTGQPVNRNSHIIPLILGHPNQIRGIYFHLNKTKLPNGCSSSYLVRASNEVNLVVKADNCN